MLQKIKDKIKLNTVIRIIPAVLFLVFIIGMAIPTFLNETVKDTVKTTEVSFYGVGQLSDQFEGVLQENFYDKDEYINLNGLTARMLGLNSLNETQKLANGHLTGFSDTVDVSGSSKKVIELNDFLNERDIDFLYLLAPYKEAFYDAKFAPGYSSNYKEYFDSMISTLNDADVVTIDMNSWYKGNGYTMDDVYYKTDHHWKPNGALAAANVTMDLIYNMGWIDSYNKEWLEEDNYTITTLKDRFLGSQGERVGIYYAGVDDFKVYFPNFETDYTFSGLQHGTSQWRYADSPLDLKYSEEDGYYSDDFNRIYLFGEDPIQRVTNTKAVSDKKVLILGDSFRRTWEYFLTSQFQDIYYLDLRYYTDGTAAQFIEEINPDIVIMCINYVGYNKLYDFGVTEYNEALKLSDEDVKEEVKLGNVSFSAKTNSENNFQIIYENLEPGKTYTLTLDSTYYSGDDESFVQMSLQDLSTNEPVYNRYFDANKNETQKWIFSVPDSEDALDDAEGNNDHVYAIYLYTGTKEHYVEPTEDVENEEESPENIKTNLSKTVTVEARNIQIQEGIVE